MITSDERYETSTFTFGPVHTRGSKQSHFRPTDSVHVERILRAIHVINNFDRVMLTCITLEPYGTVSRVLSELLNDGYIQSIDAKRQWNMPKLKAYPFPPEHVFNYSDNKASAGSAIYMKAPKWAKLLKEQSKIWKGLWPRDLKTIARRKNSKKKAVAKKNSKTRRAA